MNSNAILSQLPALPSGALETWLLCALALLPAAALARKLLTRKRADADAGASVHYATQEEFKAFAQEVRLELNGLRDRIDARFLGVSEKLEQLRTDVLASEERRAAPLQARLNDLEAGLARVDERTRR